MVDFAKDASLEATISTDVITKRFGDTLNLRSRQSLSTFYESGETSHAVSASDLEARILTGDPTEDSKILLARWRAGDGDARKQLIEMNCDLAQSIAKKNARQYRANQEDLTDVAYVALVQAMSGLFSCPHDNVRGYLTTSIDHAVTRELQAEWKLKARFEEVELEEIPIPTDPRDMIDLWDELLICCESSLESEIIRLSYEGYTLEEIGERLGKPSSTVHFRLNRVQSRYNERNGGEG